MRPFLMAALAATLLSGAASAQLLKPYCPPPSAVPNCPPGTTPGTVMPGTESMPPLPRPDDMGQVPDLNPNVFAQQSESGGVAARTFNDNFNGDFGGISCTCLASTGGIGNTSLGTNTGGTTQILRLPAGSRFNGILNTDNDSPRPTTRAYFGYNYYQNVNGSYNNGLGGTNVNRETVAFEYAFWDGTASVGMRLPFIQTNGAPLGSDQKLIGDLSILLKYAFYNNRSTGDVASAGMIVTTPTAGTGNLTLADGSALTLIDGSTLPNAVVLQPWIGGVKMFSKGYVQGLTGFLVPLDNVEPIIFNKSIGAGYFLYQNQADRFITGVIPNIEVHARLPLNHRDPNQAIFFQDQVNLSTGVHFRTERATLSPAINVPLVGPRPWNVEAVVWLNCYF